jgi:putative redox protein
MKHRTARLVYANDPDDLKLETRTGTGREIVFGDRPEMNEHSPVELVVAAVAACAGMDVAAILGKKRHLIESYVIEVEAEQRDEYPQVLTRIDIVHDVSGPTVTEEDVRRCVELSATKYCPVNAMLSAGATEIHHRYRARGTGERRFDVSGEVLVTGPGRYPDPVP